MRLKIGLDTQHGWKVSISAKERQTNPATFGASAEEVEWAKSKWWNNSDSDKSLHRNANFLYKLRWQLST